MAQKRIVEEFLNHFNLPKRDVHKYKGLDDRFLIECMRSNVRPSEAESENRFMTSQEVARYLNYGIRSVYKLIHSGELPAIKIGGHYRIEKKDLDSWIEMTKWRRQRASPKTRGKKKGRGG